jgi:hypothetical protein
VLTDAPFFEFKMKIAIIGTRGIPNHYGGFEQFAEYLSSSLAGHAHEIFVYSPHNHPYKGNTWNNVNIIHIYDPEYLIGTIGQFIYDLNSILSCRKKGFDIILQLGYTSSSIWNFLLPKKSTIITNMDGLEWKRAKYNNMVKKFLTYAEKLAAKKSDFLIADSIAIQRYLKEKYKKNAIYIPYGAIPVDNPDSEIIRQYGIEPYKYNMLIARSEPENSIEIILDGVVLASSSLIFLVIGNYTNKFGSYLKHKFKSEKRIKFIGPIYDLSILNSIRYYSNLYFHGHTVGGTNPSLLEAMASQSLICAHQNEFNRTILEEDAFYFCNAQDVSKHINEVVKTGSINDFIASNLRKIKTVFNWQQINDSYEQFFIQTQLNK